MSLAHALAGGLYPGVKVAFVRAEGAANVADAINAWASAEDNRRFLVVSVDVIGELSALIFYTKQLTPEEERDFDMVSKEIHGRLQEMRAQRAEADAKEDERKRVAEAEVKRLAAVGAKYESRIAHIKKNVAPGKEQKAALKAVEQGNLEGETDGQ